MGCVKTNAIEYETDKILLKIYLWEHALQKLNKIPVPSNPPGDSKSNMGNINKKSKNVVWLVKKVWVRLNVV